MKKILVTGGCGYIGSHTIVSLIEHGFEVISVDSMERGRKYVPERVEKITGKKIQNYQINMCNLRNLRSVFMDHPDMEGIIHFAAFKMVGESVEKPLKYYGNNLLSLMNLLLCIKEYKTPQLIFSSSSSVYGNVKSLPVKEDTAVTEQVSPYGRTKYMGELMITDFAKAHTFHALLLRYFNPAGAHDSALIGEPIEDKPLNLVPAITKTAAGRQEKFFVNGTDYPTRDGSCIRDYVHVMDIAEAHVLALEYLMKKQLDESYLDIINLGTGNGVTVLEMVHAFESASGVKLNVEYGPRREGDAEAVFADNTKAKELMGWEPKRSLESMMLSAWKWEQAHAAQAQ
ncbi:MAG: UDP-glucose 4-epimerase GalE [Bacteroidetes bacterium]|nr:UDP-glucose 4-epimerase GalE [Bacteroidota bacterium]